MSGEILGQVACQISNTTPPRFGLVRARNAASILCSVDALTVQTTFFSALDIALDLQKESCALEKQKSVGIIQHLAQLFVAAAAAYAVWSTGTGGWKLEA